MPNRPTKIWKVAAFFFLGTTALLTSFGLWLPRTYLVSRSTLVAESPEVVYARLADLQGWSGWAAWIRRLGPSAEVEIGVGETGAQIKFSGGELGEGRFTVQSSEPPKQLTIQATFGTGGVGGLHRFQLSAEDGGTRIVWSMIGNAGDGLLAAFTVGTREQLAVADFDDSLAALKACLETQCP